MKIASCAFAVFLTCTLYPHCDNQDAKVVEKRDSFATRQEFSKGGIGMVNKHLYIVVKSASSDRNELVVAPTEETEERWHGRSVDKPEVAIFYANRVWSSQSLPDGFDLSNAVVVSFEDEKVRFFDFQTMSGAYYNRIRDRR